MRAMKIQIISQLRGALRPPEEKAPVFHGALYDDPFMPVRTVFFDLDGTLVDNFTAVAVACNLTMRALDLPEIPYEKVRGAVGGSIVLTMQRLAGRELAPKAVKLYGGFFAEHWADGLFAMDGAAWLLGNLGQAGIRRAVLTNKNEAFSRRIVEHLGLGTKVEDVIGTSEEGALRGYRKPRADFMAAALARMGAKAEEALMVGDSPFDAEAGQNGGMAVRLVATGSHRAEDLAGLGALAVHRDLYDLGGAAFGFRR